MNVCISQPVDVTRHGLGLRHHFKVGIVDPEAVINVGAGDLELDRLADDDVGSFDCPRPLRARRPHENPRGRLEDAIWVGQGRQRGRGGDYDDRDEQPEPAGAQPVGSPLHGRGVGCLSGACGDPRKYGRHQRYQDQGDPPDRLLEHGGPEQSARPEGPHGSYRGRNLLRIDPCQYARPRPTPRLGFTRRKSLRGCRSGRRKRQEAQCRQNAMRRLNQRKGGPGRARARASSQRCRNSGSATNSHQREYHPHGDDRVHPPIEDRDEVVPRIEVGDHVEAVGPGQPVVSRA